MNSLNYKSAVVWSHSLNWSVGWLFSSEQGCVILLLFVVVFFNKHLRVISAANVNYGSFWCLGVIVKTQEALFNLSILLHLYSTVSNKWDLDTTSCVLLPVAPSGVVQGMRSIHIYFSVSIAYTHFSMLQWNRQCRSIASSPGTTTPLGKGQSPLLLFSLHPTGIIRPEYCKCHGSQFRSSYRSVFN